MPKPTEAHIRASVPPRVFDRGLDYYNRGQVLEATLRDNVLTGVVQGSEPSPYAVEVHLGDTGQAQFVRCTCAYAAEGGVCKHIVAVLLVAAYAPVYVDPNEAQAAQALLAELGDEQVRQAVANLLRTEPAFADAFVRNVALLRSPGTTAPTSPALFEAMVESVKRELRRQFTELHNLEDHISSDEEEFDNYDKYDKYGDYDGYADYAENPPFPADILDNQIDMAGTLLDTNEVDLALNLLSVVLEEWGIGVQDLPEVVAETYPNEIAATSAALGHTLAGVLLHPGASAEARARCIAEIDGWLDECPELELAAVAGAYGWDHPQLVAALHGEAGPAPIWGEVPDWVKANLVTVYLAQLERQERGEEYLNLAKAVGRIDLYVYRLAELGRTEQAVAEAERLLRLPGEFMQLGRILLAKGERKPGLAVAALGLESADQFSRYQLASWLRFEAEAAGEIELALKAALVVFLDNCSLEAYRAVERLAGAGWPDLKPDLHAHLAVAGRADLKCRIYLDEGMLPEAMALAEQAPDQVDLPAILELAAATQPDWCIRQCQHRAEAVIRRGASGHYPDAIPWLRRAQAIYRDQGRVEEWQAYMTRLIEANRRKYTLTPLLRALG